MRSNSRLFGTPSFGNLSALFGLARATGLIGLALIAAVTLSACSSDANGGEDDGEEAPITDGTWFRPSVDQSWHWQLSGRVQTETLVDLYILDFFTTSQQDIDVLQATGSRVLCHVSVATYTAGADDPATVHSDDIGLPVPGSEKERFLNIKSPRVLDVVRARIDEARRRGCDGIVAAYSDAYLVDTGFDVNATHQRSLNRYAANEAHLNRLGVGLKNMRQLVPDLVEYFDFVLTERCQEEGTCDAYAPFTVAGKAVFNAEFAVQYRETAARDAMCGASRTAGISSIVLSDGLDGSYRSACDS